MEIGFIGLGKMGGAMAARLAQAGHAVTAFDRSPEAAKQAEQNGIAAAETIEALCQHLKAPRTIWMMTPPGEPTQAALDALAPHLEAGDIVVDGGNSDFRDTNRRARALAALQVTLVDAGVSGGVQGARNGCGLLVGAEENLYRQLEPIFQALAAPGAYARVGGAGSGHFTKAVHNGVEYAIMQAYAEGFELLSASDFDVDVVGTLKAYQAGCSIRSYLLDKLIKAVEPDPSLAEVQGRAADSGMGRWTLEEAIRLRVPTPTIAAALHARFRSQQDDSPAMKSIAALRGVIGGHAVPKASRS